MFNILFMKRLISLSTSILFMCITCFVVQAQTRVSYTRHEAMIPMRDGIKLFTVYFTPDNISTPVPILIQRTPYGSQDMQNPNINSYLKDMAAEGYIFVTQDIRGRYRSEG